MCLDFTIAGEEENLIHKQFYIGDIAGTDGEIVIENSEDGIIHTIVNENREYNVTIGYQDSAINDFAGVWTSSNGSVVSISNGEATENGNTVKIRALSKGRSTITFKNNFTGLTKSIEVTVITHAKSIECSNVTASAETVITPNVKYFDFNDEEIDAGLISDTSFIYSNPDASEFLNVEERTNIKLTNAEFPVGTTSVVVNYSIEPVDEVPEVIPGSITITPAEYLISYTISEDSGILGHSIYGAETGISRIGYKCYAKGGQLLNFIISLEDGVELSNSAKQAIGNAFDSFEIVYSRPGRFSAMVKMPYHDISFEL